MNDQAATVQKNGGDESALHMGVAIAHFIQKLFPGVTMLVAWSQDAATEAKAFRIPDELPKVSIWLEKRSNLGCVLNKIDQSASRNKVPSAKNIEGLTGITCAPGLRPVGAGRGSATRYAANTYGNVFISTT